MQRFLDAGSYGPYSYGPRPKPAHGRLVVCRICGKNHMTLHKDDKGYICRKCSKTKD